MNEELKEVFENLVELYKARKFADLKNALLDLECVDIAIFIEEEFDEEHDKVRVFRLLPKDIASDVFVEFDTDTQQMFIKAFTDKELKAVIQDKIGRAHV